MLLAVACLTSGVKGTKLYRIVTCKGAWSCAALVALHDPVEFPHICPPGAFSSVGERTSTVSVWPPTNGSVM